MILPHYKIIIIHSLTAVIVNSNTTGYELEVFRGHLVRAMTCPTLIIPVLYSMGITAAALGKDNMLILFPTLLT